MIVKFFFTRHQIKGFAFCLCSYVAISNLKLVPGTRFFDLSTGTQAFFKVRFGKYTSL